MAQISLSTREIIAILQANGLIPHQITDVRPNGEEVKIKVRTPWPVLKSISVGMRFAGFDDGCVVLELGTNRVTDKLVWLIDRMIEPLRLEEHGGRWEYPRLYVDINRLVRRQLRGVAVQSIVFQDGLFHVVTTHARLISHCSDSRGPEDSDVSLASPA